MKIYTKKGDGGYTTLVGGFPINKSNIIVEAYGTIDELISSIGFVEGLNIPVEYKDICFFIQSKLMLCAANVADIRIEKTIKDIIEDDIIYLEERIDYMNNDLEELKNFILFRGAIPSVFNNLRTITRRAERKVIEMKEYTENENIGLVIKYLNRLSDFFFTLARHSCVHKDKTYSAIEVIWKQ